MLLYRLFPIVLTIVVFSKNKVCDIKAAFAALPFAVMVLLPFLIRGAENLPYEQRDFSIKLIIRLTSTMMTVSFIANRYSYLYYVEGVMKPGLPDFLNMIIALTFRYFFYGT